DIRWAKPVVRAGDEVDLFHFIAGAFRLYNEAADFARAGVGVQDLALVLLGQQRSFVPAHAGRRAEPGTKDFVDDTGLFLVPVRFAFATGPIAVVAAGHDVADARLLVAVVVVVAGPNLAEAVDRWFIFIAEVMSDQ